MERSALVMIIFLLVFLLIYGGLHFYMYLKAKAALNFGTKTSILVLCFLALMVSVPIVLHQIDKPGLEGIAKVVAYVGYTWMAILALFFSISIVIDLLRLLVYLAGLITSRDLSSFTSTTPYHFLIPFALVLGISFYGYFEARSIRVERITVKSSKIPQDVGSFRIVQISDVHLGVMVGERRLERILEIVRSETPDMLVSTGDLVDGEMHNLKGAMGLLKDMQPPYGKFAVTGNHEFYAGLDKSLAFTKNAGFTILRADTATVLGFLSIVGVDDHEPGRSAVSKSVSEKELLSTLPQENFRLLLKHRPVLDKDALGHFDLQLSGHAHKGQIFPLGLITRAIYPTDDGCLTLEDGSQLCVSRGAGTWGPPIRFLAPPDIVVIELLRE
jgi:predicted MPP superfamily phosphohydrolase